MKKILKIVKEKNIKVIEDCAEALGSYFNKKHVGNFGDISTLLNPEIVDKIISSFKKSN